jgi:UDP-N-acetylmuramoyl-tripeptide--D-alanyl-D-alanine ligase
VGADLGAAGLALAELQGLAGRGQRIEFAAKGGSALLIDESYNANPASMRATLKQLGGETAARRIAVLGAMKELGSHGPKYHAELAGPVGEAGVDFAILVGEEMADLARELGKSAENALGKAMSFAHCATVEEAVETLRNYGLKADDAVLVKGSNSVGLAKLVSAIAKQEGQA